MNEESTNEDANVSEKSFSMDDLPDLETVDAAGMQELTKPAPKGFRNVTILNDSDSESDSDSEDIVLNVPSTTTVPVEEKSSAEQPQSTLLEAKSEASSILNIAQQTKPEEDVEMLFQKVERPQEPIMQAPVASAAKPMIQELDSDDEES